MLAIKLIAFVIFSLISLGGNCGAAENLPPPPAPPTVNTRWGQVIGHWVAAVPGGSHVAEFRAIPYAQPPVGELRLEKTRPWNTSWAPAPRAAVEPGPICIQSPNYPYSIPGYNESEDCLYLNVWVPEKDQPAQEKIPVMVYIHGGGLMGESAAWPLYSGRFLVSRERVIMVNFNYRLGALGFLYSGNGTEDLAGNQGFWDQLEALRWVRDNIQNFGGDPQRVTIFGESGGSWSVSAHLTSPQSLGLFQNAILQSGALLSDAQLCPRLAQTGTKAMARSAGCPADGPGLKTCLKALPLDQLLAAYNASHFSTVYGDEFNPLSMRESLATGKNLHMAVNLLAGTMADEGSVIVGSDEPELLNPPGGQDLRLEYSRELIRKFWKHPPLVADVENLYLGGNSSGPDEKFPHRNGVLQSVIDGFLGCSTQEFARLAAIAAGATAGHQNSSKTGKVYGYHFRRAVTSRLVFCSPDLSPPLGPCHGDDLPLVFGYPYGNASENWYFGNYSASEHDYSDFVMKIWTTFARTGQPPAAPGSVSSIDEWRPFSSTTGTVRVMELTGPEPDSNRLLINPRAERCEMWSRHAQEFCWQETDQIITFSLFLPYKH